MQSSFIKPAFGLVLAAAAGLALAQTTQPSTTPSGSAPDAVGVTPQTATSANQQAIPRTDTGTVVRTGPTAAERARAAASSATGNNNAATGTGGTTMGGTDPAASTGANTGTGTSTATGAGTGTGTGTSTSGSSTMAATTPRPARADRN